MNPTLHIIRKDLRFNRWALVLWLAAIITHFTLRCLQIKDPSWGGTALATSSRWDHLLLFALPLIIIPFIMQADAVRKRYAFWQSLPISKTRLLFAKAITLISLFILLPMAFEISYYFLAGLESVFWNSLKIWLFLHVPLVLIAYFICYLTTGWKSYFCVMLPVVAVGAFFTTGVLKMYTTINPLSMISKRSELEIIDAPPSSIFQINESSAKIVYSHEIDHDSMFTGKPKYNEAIEPSFVMTVENLPDDIVIGEMDFDLSFTIGKTSKVYPCKSIIDYDSDFTGMHASYAPISERFSVQSFDNRKSLKTSYRYRIVPENPIIYSFPKLPIDDIKIQGKIRVNLAKKLILGSMPLTDGAKWKFGLHQFSLGNIKGGFPQLDLQGDISMRSIITDPSLLRSSSRGFPNTDLFFVIEHNDDALRSFVMRYSSGSMHYFGKNAMDYSRQMKSTTSKFDRVFENSSEWPDRGKIITARFKSDFYKNNNWNMKIINYEPMGIVEIPISLSLPVSELTELRETQTNEDAFQLGSIETQIKQATSKEPKIAFKEMARLLGMASSAEIAKHEPYIYPLLQRVFQEYPEFLIKELRIVGSDEFSVSISKAYENNQSFYGYIPEIRPFWQRVNRFLTSAVTNEHKAFILKNLQPTINQLDLLERMGWEKDAEPILAKIFQYELMPQGWSYIFDRYPTEDGHLALIRQMQFGCRYLSRIIQWVESVEDEAKQKKIVEEFWRITARNNDTLESIRLPLLIALKHGVECVPRDIRMLVEADALIRKRKQDQPRTDRAWAAIYQCLALYSDCPQDLEEGSKWILQHGDQLMWNQSSKRYELGETRNLEIPILNEKTWGKYINPIGVGRLQPIDTNSLKITTSAHEADYTANFLDRFSPRLMREVTGDFTAEVTILPEFAASPSWTGDANKIFQAAGLVLEAGQTSHLRIERTMQGPDQAQHIRERISRASKETNYDTKENSSFVPSKPISFRISRHGTEVFAAWKQEDGPWHESRAHRCVQWWQTVKIGIYVSNYCVKPFSALFKDYRITTDSNPPLVSGTAARPKVSDSIEHDAVIPRWGRLHNILNGGMISADKQKLLMRVAPSINDFNFQQIVGAPRTVNSVKGDFEQEVELDPISLEKWSGSALYLQNGYTSMFRFGPAMDKKPYLDIHSSGYNYNFYVPPHHFAVDFTKTMRLRIRRVGHLFYAGIKQEGDWQEMAPFYLKCPEEISVGVVGMNTSQKEVPFTFRDYTLKTQP
jgi:hypothetical protein